jgi:hypothetical protein
MNIHNFNSVCVKQKEMLRYIHFILYHKWFAAIFGLSKQFIIYFVFYICRVKCVTCWLF